MSRQAAGVVGEKGAGGERARACGRLTDAGCSGRAQG